MGIKEKILMITMIILLGTMIVIACYSVYNRQEKKENYQNIINEIELNQTTKTNTIVEENQNNIENTQS
mgnify:CR=1 FL=1